MLGFMTVLSIGNVLNMHMVLSMTYIITNNKKAYLINQIGFNIGGEGVAAYCVYNCFSLSILVFLTA